MTTAAKTIITVLSLVTVVAIIAGVYMHVIKGRSFSVSTKTVENKETFEGEIEILSVNADVGDLTIRPGNELSVSYSLPENMVPKISFQNGVLKLENPKGFFTLPLASNAKYYIMITIPPQSKLRSVSANLDVGDVTIEDFITGSLDIHLDAGNTELNGISTASASVHADAGNINLKKCSMDRLEVRADAGNLDIDESSVSEIDARVDAGNIKAHDSRIDAGKCKSDIGNIELSGEIGDVDVKTDLGNTSVNGRN